MMTAFFMIPVEDAFVFPFRPGPLDIASQQLFHLACYDLDRFRAHVFENSLMSDGHRTPEEMARLKTDDLYLMKAGLEWIKNTLFAH